MTWLQAIIVYFVCWWLLLFMALPVGITHSDAPKRGEEPAAPDKTFLGIKCAVVTILAALATYVIYFVIRSGIIAVT